MELPQALEIVLDLATDNSLEVKDYYDGEYDKELQKEALEQEEAIIKVEDFLRTNNTFTGLTII